MLFFDLDNTLVDTKEMVLRAYEAAGVAREHVKPGVPADRFLVDAKYGRVRDIIGMKNAAYAEIVREEGVRELPAFEVFTNLKSTARGICTGASIASVRIVLRSLGVPEHTVTISAAARPSLKPRLLSVLGARGYVDDDESTRQG
ncbi:MAG TPA: hypothetical protein PLB92_14125, partial [Rhodoglobus sp.]|nr:hypothetical protein [Rhodoglobus sp.]